MGVDTGQGGKDQTCWTIVDGQGVIKQLVSNVSDAMEIGRHTIDLIEEHEIPTYRVARDSSGGGKEGVDWLNSTRCEDVVAVWFGSQPDDKRVYANRRAELYDQARICLRGKEGTPFLLPPDADLLREELAVLPVSRDSEGRLLLPPKDSRGAASAEACIRKPLGRSPDRSDLLVLAISAMNREYWNGWYEGDFAWVGPSKPRMTDEEIAELPDWLRELLIPGPDEEYDDDDEPR